MRNVQSTAVLYVNRGGDSLLNTIVFRPIRSPPATGHSSRGETNSCNDTTLSVKFDQTKIYKSASLIKPIHVSVEFLRGTRITRLNMSFSIFALTCRFVIARNTFEPYTGRERGNATTVRRTPTAVCAGTRR